MNEPLPFHFLFIEPMPEAAPHAPSFDATAVAARIAGRAQPNGKHDKILILNTAGGRDAHAEALVAELMSRGVRPYFLQWHELLRAVRVGLELSNELGARGLIETRAGDLALEEVSAVWCRSPWTAPIETGLDAEADNFAQHEADAVFNGLAGLLRDALWVNHPNAVYAAEDKLLQLQYALELGLPIPRTLVTNDPARAREFFELCDGAMIVKSFRRPRLGAPLPRSLFTSRVTREHFAEMERVQYAPCLFQEYVPKDYELRVTLVGTRVFAAEIHSQQSETDRDDYRHYDFANTKYFSHTLPREIEHACLALAKRFDANYAALDLIRRPDGEYVFLEINANAQYLWIQDLTGLRITAALADLVMSGTGQGGETVR